MDPDGLALGDLEVADIGKHYIKARYQILKPLTFFIQISNLF